MRSSLSICQSRRYVALFSFAAILFAVAEVSAQKTVTQSNADVLLADVQQLRYDDLEHDLGQTPPGFDRDLFEGILANRANRLDESVRLLTPIVATTDITHKLMALALAALADDEVKLFQYADASRLYDRLLGDYRDQLSPAWRRDDGDDNAILKTLLNVPPQTITFSGPVDLPTHSDPLGSFIADLTVNRVTQGWILDTGANISAISESFAKRIGIPFSSSIAETLGASGAENPLHTGIIPKLRIGGATLHNVVMLILPDANLTIPTGKHKTYIIPAILGYPVFQSLGSIRFTHDHHFLAGPDLQTTGDSSRIYMDKLTPLLDCGTHGRQRVFAFDSGASSTQLFVAYYKEFSADFLKEKKGKSRYYGAGGVATSKVYILDSLQLQIAGRTAVLHHVPVLPEPLGVIADRTYGNLGRGIPAQFESMTLDFTHARVYLGTPLSHDAH